MYCLQYSLTYLALEGIVKASSIEGTLKERAVQLILSMLDLTLVAKSKNKQKVKQNSIRN